MSGVDYFDDQAAINPFMDSKNPVDRSLAHKEHESIKSALESAGVEVVVVPPPKDCQDGVYTANWALVRGNKAVLSCLPNARKSEEPYAESCLENLGIEVIHPPTGVRFSGQGDALPCGNLLFMGTNYRTDEAAHKFVAGTLGYQVIPLQTIPKRTWYGQDIINKSSGWPDSFFYDIDLAIAILRPPLGSAKGLIAWCPEAFMPKSRKILKDMSDVDKIEVSLEEAKQAFACNLVSTGNTVVMSSRAPKLRSQIEAHGFRAVTPDIHELAKGGGYIRCTTLTMG